MKVYSSLWSAFWPPNTSESDEPPSPHSDDTMFVIATQSLVNFGKNIFLKQIA